MARRPTTQTDPLAAFATEGVDTFAHIVQAAIAPVNTDGALEQIARKAFNNGMKRPGITFEGVLAEVLKEGIRLERVTSASVAPAPRGRGRPKGSMGVAKPETNGASGPIGTGGTANISRGDGEERESDAEVAARVSQRGSTLG